jgi:hypothetical protein
MKTNNRYEAFTDKSKNTSEKELTENSKVQEARKGKHYPVAIEDDIGAIHLG